MSPKRTTNAAQAPVMQTKSKPKKAAKPIKPLSALDAAAKVLAERGEPMTSGQLIEAMAEKNYWKSPGGQTPAATLYSGLLREIGNSDKQSRFARVERGKFALVG